MINDDLICLLIEISKYNIKNINVNVNIPFFSKEFINENNNFIEILEKNNFLFEFNNDIILNITKNNDLDNYSKTYLMILIVISFLQKYLISNSLNYLNILFLSLLKIISIDNFNIINLSIKIFLNLLINNFSLNLFK